jgi:hypothetical protein
MLSYSTIAGALPDRWRGAPRFSRGVRKRKILEEPSFLR